MKLNKANRSTNSRTNGTSTNNINSSILKGYKWQKGEMHSAIDISKPKGFSQPSSFVAMQKARLQSKFKLELCRVVPQYNLRGFFVFYFTQVIINALILALFAVQAFGEHGACTSPSGRDLSRSFTYMFGAGFILNTINFLNQTYIDPYFRFQRLYQNEYEDVKKGHSSAFVATMNCASAVLEGIMTLALVTLSAVMLVYGFNTSGLQCVDNSQKALASEKTWLIVLAIAQVFKICLYSLLKSSYG